MLFNVSFSEQDQSFSVVMGENNQSVNSDYGEVVNIKGDPGYTPVKGVDYFTEADKTELLKELMEALGSRISYIDLLSANWEGISSPYSQVISIGGTTEYSKIDLNPSVEQLAVFHEKDIAFVVENEDGVITVYCVGQKPLDDYTMQVSITEVSANG